MVNRILRIGAFSVLALPLVLGAAVGGLAWYFSDFDNVVAWFGVPTEPFEEQAPPRAPDYAQLHAWVAHPEIADGSDEPLGDEARPPADADRLADVFFVHPTTYVVGGTWNGPLDDGGARTLLDQLVMPMQASAFAHCCRVWAPRYRQAILSAFFPDQHHGGPQALDLAYGDVERAFDVFVQQLGDRPFILAGHSQGTLHASRLLREHIAGTPLQDRLVAAYLVGFPTPMPTHGIEACDGPRQIGCGVAWRSMEQASPDWADILTYGETGWTRELPPQPCTNPLTWKQGDAAPATANLGTTWAVDDQPVTPQPGLVPARCDGSRLVIEPPADPTGFDFLMGETRQDWHLYDYHLFYANIRANAVERVDAWLDAHATPVAHDASADPTPR